jgi:hypothetical protein
MVIPPALTSSTNPGRFRSQPRSGKRWPKLTARRSLASADISENRVVPAAAGGIAGIATVNGALAGRGPVLVPIRVGESS